MSKEITRIVELADEVADIVYQKRFESGMSLLEMRFMIGEVLVKSPLWKRDTKVELMKEIEARCSLGERSLRYCAEFFEQYETWDNVMANADPDKKLPAWREIVKGLPSGTKTEKVEHRPCRHCPYHCYEMPEDDVQ